MSSLTFPRSFLQSIVEQRRQEQIDHIIQTFIAELRWTAGQGLTRYVYDPNRYFQKATMLHLTKYELLLAFRERFPDCKVYWADCEANCNIYKRAVVIDWA